MRFWAALSLMALYIAAMRFVIEMNDEIIIVFIMLYSVLIMIVEKAENDNENIDVIFVDDINWD